MGVCHTCTIARQSPRRCIARDHCRAYLGLTTASLKAHDFVSVAATGRLLFFCVQKNSFTAHMELTRAPCNYSTCVSKVSAAGRVFGVWGPSFLEKMRRESPKRRLLSKKNAFHCNEKKRRARAMQLQSKLFSPLSQECEFRGKHYCKM